MTYGRKLLNMVIWMVIFAGLPILFGNFLWLFSWLIASVAVIYLDDEQ
jgi:hypothetical protein